MPSPSVYVDIKPMMKPSKRKLDAEAESDSDDHLSSPSPNPKKPKVKREKKPTQKKEPRETKPKVGTGGAKSSAWSKAQVRQLWDALDMKPGKINWDHVSAQVDGRGKIACRDKWLKMIRPRLDEFIDSLGE